MEEKKCDSGVERRHSKCWCCLGSSRRKFFFLDRRKEEMSCRGVEVVVNELDCAISYLDSGMRGGMIGAWCASEWLD